MEANPNLNNVCPPAPKKHKVSIKDAKELMIPLHELMDMIFEGADKMENGIYIDLCNKIKDMSEGEFFIELSEIYKKKQRASYQRIKVDNRKMVKQRPDIYMCCPNCNEAIQKRSLATHLKSQICKDKAYTIKATKDLEKPNEETNDKIVELYDTNHQLDPVVLTAENYFWGGQNIFDSPY